MKDRNISILEFFRALQREFLCLEIRSKIYIGDKEYFGGLMAKKKSAILAISKKNNLPNIIEDEDENLRVWREIVPKFGFPKLIYNIISNSDVQLSFPYRGTIVKADEKIGISNRVNFKDDTVEVILSDVEEPVAFKRKNVRRLGPQETDEFYYYYPNNYFNTKDNGIGKLKSYDLNTKEAVICFEDGSSLILHRDVIARIL